MDRAVFVIDPSGVVRGLYTDNVDLLTLGPLRVTRASEVEFDPVRQGWVVMILDSGERLGPFARRDRAIEAEIDLLTARLSVSTLAGPITPRSVTNA